MRVAGVVAPGKQAEDGIGIQHVYRRVQFKAVAAVAERARRNNFSALPMICHLREAQMELAGGIDPDVVGAVRKIIWTWPDGCPRR